MNEGKSRDFPYEEQLDELLNEIYSTDIFPSEKLVKMTKASLKKTGILEHILTLSIITSFAANLCSIYIVIYKLNSIWEKAIALSVSSVLTNIIIIFVFVYRNDIKNLINRFEN